MVNPNIWAWKKWLEEHAREEGDPWNLWIETKKKMGIFVVFAVLLLLASGRD